MKSDNYYKVKTGIGVIDKQIEHLKQEIAVRIGRWKYYQGLLLIPRQL